MAYKIAVFDTKDYDKPAFERQAAETGLEFRFYETRLTPDTVSLAAGADEGIRRYGVVEHPVFGKIYAYETDGLGNYVLMDDANSPSLLAMPYLGYCEKTDPIYLSTRRFILSKENPFYFSGKAAKGVGSPHTGPDKIWHIALTMQALTSTSEAEICDCLTMLASTTAGTNYMHESFNKDDPADYTRSWFAWANSLFAQMLSGLVME